FFPMLDGIAVLKVTFDELVLTLENGVSRFPNQDGRFLHVSGMSFTFDPSRPAGSRVVSVLVGGEPMISGFRTGCVALEAVNGAIGTHRLLLSLLPCAGAGEALLIRNHLLFGEGQRRVRQSAL